MKETWKRVAVLAIATGALLAFNIITAKEDE